MRAESAMLGQPSVHLVWSEEAPQGSDFAFDQGSRYAVLASVSSNYSLSDITSYLTGHGWTVTYAWEQGQASRALYPVDDWLSSLPPDSRSGHRWVYVEANRTGESTSIGESAPWPLTIYAISHVLKAVPGGNDSGPVLPQAATVTAPLPSGPSAFAVVVIALVGAAVGIGGWSLARSLL